MVYITTTLLLVSLLAQAQETVTTSDVPNDWLDSRIDAVDREAMEKMITFAPPSIPSEANWVLPEGEEAPTWSELRGKVIVFQSWTNAKPSGRLAIRAVIKTIFRIGEPEDVVLITIHTPQKHGEARSYIEKKAPDLRTVIDTTGEICNLFGFYRDPMNIVIDRNGAVRYAGLRTRGLTKAIKGLLEESEQPGFEVEPFEPSGGSSTKTAMYPDHSDNFGRANNMQGKPAPAFFIDQWISNPVEVDGKVLLVEFWATWCAPCRRSIPHLNELAKHFGDDIAIIGVSSEEASKVRPFISKTPMNYGVAIDAKRTMQKAIACTSIPFVMVVSSDGIVRWQGNPIGLTKNIVQQVLSADRGDSVPLKRGRWDTSIDHGK